MVEFGKIERVSLRSIWPREAADFSPWLAENLPALGEALGMDLELLDREAEVGGFSLDILARDLGVNRSVVIENQLTTTDHDHLGKLLTYASGFDAGVVIWISETLREEHRQALEWLNQRTDSDTSFFGVTIQVLTISDSPPAYDFKVLVSPNEWRREKRRTASTSTTVKGQAYREFFQQLVDELREEHRFTNARVAQAQNWYQWTSGFSGIGYGANFGRGDRLSAELYIDQGDRSANKRIFDALLEQRDAIEHEVGAQLEWDRLDDRIASRVRLSTDGRIEMPDAELAKRHTWLIENLLKIKSVFGPRIESILSSPEGDRAI